MIICYIAHIGIYWWFFGTNFVSCTTNQQMQTNREETS